MPNQRVAWTFFANDKYSVGVDFNSFGFEEYYRRNKFAVWGGYEVIRNLRVISALKIRAEKFNRSGTYTGTNLDIHLIYAYKKYLFGLGTADYWLKAPYVLDNDDKFKYSSFVSYAFNDDLVFSTAVRRFDNRRTRWLFDQKMRISEMTGLNFGYSNNPDCLYGGLDLTIKGVSFILRYYSLGELSDTIIWGISFKR